MALRRQIYTSSSAKEAFAQIDFLYDLYLTQFKKKMETQLFFSSEGDDGRPIYGVTAYYEDKPEQIVELEWLFTNVS